MPSNKVLFVNMYSIYGGAEKYLENIIYQFSKNDSKYEPLLLTAKGRIYDAFKDKIDIFCSVVTDLNFKRNILRIFLIPYFIFSSFICFFRIFSITKNIKIIYANNFYSAFYSLLFAKIKNIPLIFHYHGIGEKQTKSKIYRCLISFLGNFSDIVIVPGDITRQQLIQFGITKTLIKVSPNGINLNEFVVSDSEKTKLRKEIRAKYKINDNQTLFLQVAVVIKAKGQSLIVDLFKRNPEKFSNIKFLFVGEMKDSSININNFEDKDSTVRFIGFHEDIRPFLCACDVFILPSRSEVFPVSLIEAMAYGKPSIVFDVGGIRDLLSDKEAILIKEKDKDALLSAISIMANDYKKREEMSINAQNKSFNYSIEKTYDLISKCFNQLLT